VGVVIVDEIVHLDAFSDTEVENGSKSKWKGQNKYGTPQQAFLCVVKFLEVIFKIYQQHQTD